MSDFLEKSLKPWRRAAVTQGKPHGRCMRSGPFAAFVGAARLMPVVASCAAHRTGTTDNFATKLKRLADREGEFALNTAHSLSGREGRAATPVCRNWSDRQVRNLGSTTRILVVDDYAPAAEALATALSYEGFDTRFAFSGIEALGMVDTWVPHVIVLDINMPEHDGFETASIMRRLTVTRHLGIIAFTALSDVEVGPRAHVCGFDAYCQKGSPLHHLIELIDGLVVRRPPI